jgi:hypothetical protein
VLNGISWVARSGAHWRSDFRCAKVGNVTTLALMRLMGQFFGLNDSRVALPALVLQDEMFKCGSCCVRVEIA